MTPERWKKAKEIFQSAIQRAPDERSAFLDSVSGGDEALRQEVESLLAAHEKDGSFIDSPAYEAATEFLRTDQELKPGQTIGHYEILSTLGRGGMGEVYLARDTKLGRKVALKFLPSDFTKNPERLRRFEQEARAVSALNHPNILTIHEVGDVDGRNFIATEYVDGQTLRQRLAGGGLKVEEALETAIQIVSALAAAHQEGIVHRDVKPDNIMLRRDGLVKLLDFGLAKLSERKSIDPEDATLGLLKTGTGAVMGTVTHMSPEQARGLSVDARTDIWSLGVVLYEMLSGRPPFAGQTSSDLLVSILDREPERVTNLSPATPEALEWIVSKALTKDRDGRYQTAADMLNELQRLKHRLDVAAEIERSTPQALRGGVFSHRGPQSRARTSETLQSKSTLHSAFSRLRRDRWVVVLGTVMSVVVLIGVAIIVYLLAGWIANRQTQTVPENTGVLRTVQVTTWTGLDFYPSFSPDGSSIAYSSERSGSFEIYVKQLAPGGREIQITSDGQQNFEPAWSPDGRLIAYHSRNRGGIWVMPALGGAARQLTDFGSYPAWSPDGSLIAFQSNAIGDNLAGIGSGALSGSTIWTMPLLGGQPKQITKVGNPPAGHGTPAWSPDGERIVFGAFDPSVTEVWSISSQGDQLKLMAHQAFDPIYSPDGAFVYFGSFKNLAFGIWKIRVLPDTGEPVGDPIQLVNTGSGVVKRLTVSSDGTKLVYSALLQKSNLFSVALSRETGATPQRLVALTQETSYRVSNPIFSPDGKRIAYSVNRTGLGNTIWLMDSDGRNQTQLAHGPANTSNQANASGGSPRNPGGFSSWPSWFPNGDRIAFFSQRQGRNMLLSIPVNGGKESVLIDTDQDITAPRMSPDGKQVIFNSTRAGTANLWSFPLEGGVTRQLTFDKEMIAFGSWSPDGQFLAFEMKRGDNDQIAIMPSAGGMITQLTSERGQSWPHTWSPDGDKIAFAGSRNGIWNVWSVSRSTKQQKQLTNYAKLNAFVRYPAWSPLGNQIVYEYAETTGNIWLMELK
jgi:Tol biopolymer transport system component/predicted Ser/Thr protein kinase